MFTKEQNLEVGAHSVGLQAGGNIGDVIINYPSDEVSFPIIAEIIEHISGTSEYGNIESNASVGIRTKARLNFNTNASFSEFGELYGENRAMMNAIGDYLKTCDQNKIDGLVFKIRSLFTGFKNTECYREKVGNVQVFTHLAEKLVPKKDGSYLKYTVSLMLYIFEMCEFGAITEEETQSRLLW